MLTRNMLKKTLKRKHQSDNEVALIDKCDQQRKTKKVKSIKIPVSDLVLREADWQAPRKLRKSSSMLHDYYDDIKLMIKSANGILYSATEKVTGRPVCIKKISKKTTFTKLENGSEMPTEFYYHFKAAEVSSTVVEPLTWLEFGKYFIIVMERPEDSIDLFEVSKKYGALTEPAAVKIISQLVECTQALHNVGICHRDIKDENLLFNMNTLEIKLIDFGSATNVSSAKYHSPKGTPAYFPPEFFLEDAYAAEELTIWSIGAVFYILLNAEWNFEKPYFKRNYEKEEKLSSESLNIINGTLCSNPVQRFSFETLSDRLETVSNIQYFPVSKN